MYNSGKKFRKAPFIFLFILAVVFGLPAIIMLLWNEILPPLIHVSSISYWHSLGLLVLCRILFGGFRGAGRHGGWRGQAWREKWSAMSPEEKEALKQKMKERWGKNC